MHIHTCSSVLFLITVYLKIFIGIDSCNIPSEIYIVIYDQNFSSRIHTYLFSVLTISILHIKEREKTCASNLSLLLTSTFGVKTQYF